MKCYNKKILTITIIVALVLLAITTTIFFFTKNETDALKFKKEYEAYNNETNSSGKTYRNLNISKNNPIIYLTPEELLEKINNKETFVIYFGFATCPWCRSVIETLFDVASDFNMDKIYYVDVSGIRDVMEIDSSNNITTKTRGTDSYYKLLEKFNDVLADYTLKDSSGNVVKTGEKRIYAPNVASITKGNVKELTTGISSLETDPYMELTSDMKDEMYQDFKCIIKCTIEADSTCSIDKSC